MKFLLIFLLVALTGCQKPKESSTEYSISSVELIRSSIDDISYLFCVDETFSIEKRYDQIPFQHKVYAIIPNSKLIAVIEYEAKPNSSYYSEGITFNYPWFFSKTNNTVNLDGFIKMISLQFESFDSFLWNQISVDSNTGDEITSSLDLDRSSLRLSEKAGGFVQYFDCIVFNEKIKFEQFFVKKFSEYSEYANEIESKMKAKRKI